MGINLIVEMIELKIKSILRMKGHPNKSYDILLSSSQREINLSVKVPNFGTGDQTVFSYPRTRITHFNLLINFCIYT